MNIGWIDFSKEQRNKVLNVINLLSEPEAVDELGIGIVRDAFADIFFPGTSTIQTRAKYFLLTPYILSELERVKGIGPDKLIDSLHQQELDLIDILKKSRENGVIGESAGRNLKRKPSDIYWNGIRTFGIFTSGKISLSDYARLACLVRDKKQSIKALGSLGIKDDEKDSDDIDAVLGELGRGFWKLPDFTANWRDELSIRPTRPEAEFLRKQIVSAVPDTMLSFVLDGKHNSVLLLESFEDIEGVLHTFPESIKADYIMAREFSDFVFGTHLRYNVMLSEGKEDEVLALWEEWNSEIEKHASLDLQKILLERLRINNGKLFKFLAECQYAMLNKDIAKLDELIIKRERLLKGDKRAKLLNPAEFDYRGWVGIGKLQYRFYNAKNLWKDIFEALGDENV